MVPGKYGRVEWNGREWATGEARLYVEVSDEIRHLLHQFAAGFLHFITTPAAKNCRGVLLLNLVNQICTMQVTRRLPRDDVIFHQVSLKIKARHSCLCAIDVRMTDLDGSNTVTNKDGSLIIKAL